MLQRTPESKDSVILGNHKADEAAKLAAKASNWKDNDLVQNLEVQHKIPPKDCS